MSLLPMTFSVWDLVLTIPAVLILAAFVASGSISKDSLPAWAVYRRMVLIMGATLMPYWLVSRAVYRGSEDSSVLMASAYGVAASIAVWLFLGAIPPVRNWLREMSLHVQASKKSSAA